MPTVSLRLRSLVIVAMVALVSSGCVWIQRASVDSAENEANGDAFAQSISADGRYVAFSSSASNLVAGDTNDASDVFVRDTVTGTTIRVSVDSAGTQGNSSTWGAAISSDGRYIALFSFASNLVAGDTNGQPDVFVRDTVAGTTTRVSVDSAEAQGPWGGHHPTISADGRYVAFESFSANLVAGDTNNATDIFVRDTVAGTTTRVNVDSAEAQANIDSTYTAISADGHYVAFLSYATNLVAGDTNNKDDVFVRDTVAGTTTRVNVDSAGAEANDEAFDPAISDDGRYVVFNTFASNLVPDDTFSSRDVFVRDTVAGTTAAVTVSLDGTLGDNFFADHAGISGDGRYVVFSSDASTLIAGDTNNKIDVFVRDMVACATKRVSLDGAGAQANDDSSNPYISADGRRVAFDSDATNLVADDTIGARDVITRANR